MSSRGRRSGGPNVGGSHGGSLRPSGGSWRKTGTSIAESSALHDRLKFVVLNMTGQVVEVRLKSGQTYVGLFAGTTNEEKFELVLHMAHDKRDPDHFVRKLVINPADLVLVEAANVSLAGHGNEEGGFAVDRDIASQGRDPAGLSGERELQRWVPDEEDNMVNREVDLTLTGSSENWDQFAVNRRLFGVESTWDEDLYTTKLEKEKFTQEDERRASAIAGEIEKKNRERSFRLDQGLDEEDLHSAVLEEKGRAQPKNRYLPPAARAQAEVAKKAVSGEQAISERSQEKPVDGKDQPPPTDDAGVRSTKMAEHEANQSAREATALSTSGESAEEKGDVLREREEAEKKKEKNEQDAAALAAALPSIPQIKTLGGVFSISNLNPEARGWAPPSSSSGPSPAAQPKESSPKTPVSDASVAKSPARGVNPSTSVPRTPSQPPPPSLGDIKVPLSEIYYQAALHVQQKGPGNHKAMDYQWPGSRHGRNHKEMLENDVYAVIHPQESTAISAVTPVSTHDPTLSTPTSNASGSAASGLLNSPAATPQSQPAVSPLGSAGLPAQSPSQLQSQAHAQSLLMAQHMGRGTAAGSAPQFGMGQVGTFPVMQVGGRGGQMPPITPGGLLPHNPALGLGGAGPNPHAVAMLQQQRAAQALASGTSPAGPTGTQMAHAQAQQAHAAQLALAQQQANMHQLQQAHYSGLGPMIGPAQMGQDPRFASGMGGGMNLGLGAGNMGLAGRGVGQGSALRPSLVSPGGRGSGSGPSQSLATSPLNSTIPGNGALPAVAMGRGRVGAGQALRGGLTSYAAAVSAPRGRGRGRGAIPIVRPPPTSTGRGADGSSKSTVPSLQPAANKLTVTSSTSPAKGVGRT